MTTPKSAKPPPVPPARLATRTATVIMQPTTACNLDCGYCYLPQRHSAHRMPLSVAAATAESVNGWCNPDPPIEVYWHCGEPLVAGRKHLAALMATFDHVEHCVQTNATLIDDAWCRFFRRHHVRVSVSIDAPSRHPHRRTRGGEAADPQIRTGIDALHRHGIPFTALTVISNPDPDRAAELLEFFRDLGCTRLGVLLDKQLGTHTPPLRPDRARTEAFWVAMAEAWIADPTLPVREIEQSLHAVTRMLAGNPRPLSPVDPLPCITWNGDVVLVAPEFAGYRDPRFGDFVSGNVLTESLDTVLRRDPRRTWWLPDYLTAVGTCATSCPYRHYCHGPDPAASYFGHGDLRRGLTTHCRDSVIARAEAISIPLLIRARAHRCTEQGFPT